MKNKLFGKNISPDCSYCEHAVFEQGRISCAKAKQLIDGRCRAFSYDPLMRTPVSITLHGTYTADDFKL